MIDADDPEAWADLIAQLDEPPALEVADAVAGAFDVDSDRAYQVVEEALDAGTLVENDTGAYGSIEVAENREQPAEDTDIEGENPRCDGEESPEDAVDKYRRVYLDAADRADREAWEYVEEEAVREALAEIGFEELLDNGTLFDIRGWRIADVSENDEEPRRRWFYPSGNEPRPDEFRRFDQLLTEAAPDEYEPHYFRVAPSSKDPATQFGSWKTDEARLTVDEAVDWMESGGNVGIAGRPEGPLVNVDIDDDEETTPDDVPTSLRARSRSRTGWHTWYFDENDEIPNIPTDEYGEVRTNWQYVVAPGSFVASTSEAIPDDADEPGYYTVEDEEPVASIEYDDLPDVFHEFAEEIEQAEEEADESAINDEYHEYDDENDNDGRSAVFGVEADDLVTGKEPSDRFTSIFHDSGTHSNMSASNDLLHCWRHGVTHGGLQALATLSDVDHVRSFGCSDIGAPKKHSNAGPNRLKGDWRLVWGAWHEAKNRGVIPDDDPIPYGVLTELAVADGLVEREELVERDSDTGEIVADPDSDVDTYTALPSGIYNDLLDHVREEYDVDPGRDAMSGGDSREEADHRTDPRERDATVDMRRAWDAAGRVTPDELEADLALDHAADGEAWIAANGDRVGDVVRAVALDAGMIDTADDDLDDYPAAYNRAREEYAAPIPRYYTTADAIAEFDAVLDVIGEVTYWDLDVDAFASDVTEEGDEVDGDAVRALNPSWRESESEASVIVFDSGTVWDADTERVIDAVRFVALDSGLIESPEEPLEGGDFTEAYARTRTEYGAPLPRWEPAADGRREITPQLPPAEDLLDTFEYDDGVDTDALEAAREDVEDLVGELVEDTGAPSVITSLPATGKTTGTIKTARDRPLSYLAPRKELQAQALDKAEEWGVDAEILPVYCDETIRDDVLDAAIQHVRSAGKDRLRDRWAILTAALEAAGDDGDVGDLDPEDIFVDEEEADGETVDLDRPTCETARGDHGVAWALVVHIARALGYTPREIHQHAEGLFGASLPCDAGEATCEYTDGWDTVADPDDSPELLVGSYVHAHVESARTAYSRDHTGDIERTPRSIVLDEFPGEAFVREFDGEAVDHATWLARSLVDHVADRRDMRAAQLHHDEWVTAWLDGRGDEVIPTTIRTLERIGSLFDAREAAADLVDEVDSRTLDELGIEAALETVRTGNAAEAYDDLAAAIEAVDPEQPAAGVARWADEAVREPLARATVEGDTEPDLDAVSGDETIPSEGDLRDLVDRAVEAVEEARDDARAAVKAAVTALRGGREGCRQLAAWADDGYAHPDAHHLLEADMTPTGERETVDVDDLDSGQRIYTDSWAFDENATEGTVVDRVKTGAKATVVADRNDHGALLHTPPARESGGGEEAALVGLDATGRAELWATALGEEVDTADIHTTPGERAEFLESALGLRVIQAADRPRPYEGDPTTKDTDGDVALLETIADEYSGIEAARSRDEGVDAVGKPAAITTKGVRDVLENDTRLDDVVAEFENYGNVTGANDLGDHRLAAILGSQHYGDHAIERFCALGGEEVDTSRDGGRGAALDYGNDLANTYLKHMREDQTMQAALRFARGDSGATIVARTSALREDLPVVGRGQVVETWSDTATEIARRYRQLGGRFSIGDVADAVDVTKRQVRRVLAELTEAGYLRRVEAGDGIASVYEPSTAGPGAGEVDLPERADAVDSEPGHSASNEYYTWNVRVSTLSEGVIGDDTAEPSTALGAPPSPAVATGERGPQSGGEGRPI